MKVCNGQFQVEVDGSITEFHVSKIHQKSDGYITLATKNDNQYSQWHYKLDELTNELKKVVNGNNVYISQNTFFMPKRRIETIKHLENCYVDVDCYTKNIDKKTVLALIEQSYGTIPRPNMIIDSGRGLYLIWTIETAPSKILPLWYAVMRYLYNQLKDLGADATAIDPTRILRLAGTKNSKTDTEVKILDIYDYRYTLREIRDGYLPELKEKRGKAIGKVQKYIVKTFTQSSLYYARLMDLVVLCEIRMWDMKGKREIVCFLYRYWTCCFIQSGKDALRQTIEFNQQFIEPLSESEVMHSTASAENAFFSKDKQYKYKNETLIELLGITYEEQKRLKTIICKEEKYKRNNERRKNKRRVDGFTKKEREKQKKMDEIKRLREQGFKQDEIAKKLCYPKQTVSFYVKELNKYGQCSQD